LLENPARVWENPAFTYKQGAEAVQYGDLRHIEYEDGSQEMYDHANDPDEWTNLVNDVDYAAALAALRNMSPFPDVPPGLTNVFEFLDNGPLDQAGTDGSFTIDGLTLSTVDIIGMDGTRATSGQPNTAHLTQSGSTHGLGVNSDFTDKAVLFQVGEGWEFIFNRDVRLQSIHLANVEAVGAAMTLTSLSNEFSSITLSSGNGDYDLNNTFVPAGSVVHVGYSVDTGNVDDGAQIMSLTVVNAEFDYYDLWAVQQGLTEGVNDAYDADPDGDGMMNLIEYAIGAHALTNDAALYQPCAGLSEHNGTNYLNLVYRRRRDSGAHGLDYQVRSGLRLTGGALSNAAEMAGSQVLDNDFEMVTNRIPTDIEDAQFMQLKIIKE
jgi:hypothetical protein